MKNILYFIGIVTLISLSYQANSQVSGTVNIPGTFATLEAAVSALNTQGVGAGGATINLLATQNAPTNGYQLGSTTLNNSLSDANPLTFNGNANTINGYVGSRAGSLLSGLNDGIFILNGPDYVTFNNIVFADLPSNNTPTLAMEHAVGMYNASSTAGSADGCKFITITNCTFNMGDFASAGAAVTARQYLWNTSTAVAWESGSTVDIHSNILIDNNIFSSFYNGIHFRGAPSRNGRSLVVTNNTFTGVGGGSVVAYGVFTLYLDSIIFNNNTSEGDLLQTTTSYHCFTSTSSGGPMEFNNNDLTLTSGTTTGLTAGINSTSIGANRTLNNNRIRFGSFPAITSATIDGLRTSYSGGNQFIQDMNNNVIMDETLPPTTGTITLLFNGASSAAGRIVNMSNNIIQNLTKSNSGIINCIQPGTAFEVYVNDNTVSNITVTNNSVSGASTLRGIYAFGTPPSQFIFSNTISNLTISGTSTSTLGILRGIESNTTTTGVSDNYDNIVSNLSFGVGTHTGTIAGMYFAANAQNTYRNNISNLSARQANGIVYGMWAISGPTLNFYNNFISGLSAPESNSNIGVAGMHFTSTIANSQVNIFHNTIFPSSAGPLTSTGTLFGAAGIQTSNSANPTFNIINNIVNITGTANGDAYISAVKKQLAGTNGTKPAQINASNNIYNAPYIFGEGLVLSTANNVYYITGGTSGTADPDFNTPCGLYKSFMGETGTFSENNLASLPMNTFAPSGVSFAESNAISTDPEVADDYSGVARSTFADVGALEFNGVALDATGPIITYEMLPNSICNNSVRLIAEITDPSGVNTTTAKPRVYFKRSTHSNILPPQNTSLSNGWKFVEASNTTSPFIFDVDFSLLFGAPPATGWEIEYFVVAQDEAAVPNVGTNQANYPAGFCPSTVVLPTTAFPVSNFNSFNIIAPPTSVTTQVSRDELCVSGDLVLSLGGDIATGAEYQWQSSPAGANTWTDIVGAINSTLELTDVNESTDYRCIISCGGTPIAASPSTVATVNVTNPEILSTQGASSCVSPAVLTLSASASVGADIEWYDVPNGGIPVGTGPTFVTPSLTTTTTYYVSASEGSSTEPAAKPTYITTPNTSGNAWGLVFNVINDPIVINSVEVYSVGTGGSMVVELRDNTGALITSVGPFTYPAGSVAAPVPVTFNLDLPVEVGTGWRIQSAAMTGALIRETSDNTYPYISPSGNVAVTSGFITNPGSATYYWFYNWVVTTGCSSERVPVTAAVVTDNPICPEDLTVCLDTPAFELSGGFPEGGVYTGTGVIGTQFSPAVAGAGTHTITYTICGFSCTFIITVSNPIPTITITENSGATPNDGQICNGDEATLSASMAVSYLWSTGATTQSIIVSEPGTYFVTVTDENMCTGANSATIVSEPLPNIVPTLVQPTTCISTDGSITLNITSPGTFTYLWNTGSTTNSVVNASVGDYVVTITNTVTGCEYIEIYSLIGPGGCDLCPTIPLVDVSPLPLCQNGNFDLTASGLTDMGGNYGIEFKYFTSATTDPYTGGISLGIVPNGSLTSGNTIASAVSSIAVAGSYTVYAILSPAPADSGCRPSASVNIVVNALPNATITVTENSGLMPNDGTICEGATATLTASGGVSYLWSTGAATAAINVTAAGTYTVTVTSSAGCTSTASRVITVTPLSTISIAVTEASGTTANDGIICEGASATLTVVGAGTYMWSTGATTQSITVNTAGTYTVTLTNANGCASIASRMITVNPLPVATIMPMNPSIIEGNSITLTADGGVTYRWNTNATTQSITVAPITTTTYTVTVTSAAGCTSVTSAIVTVLPPPCYLVCSGEQNITLPPGACEYTLPNLMTITGTCSVYRVNQVSGPTPGTTLGVGSYTLKYELIRISTGEVFDDCEFTINIQGFTNPVGTLACNNHVNISIDENCRVTFSADMFLEGGPYACYWDYQINIWPFGSQANAINGIPQNVGLEIPFGTHTYEVVGSDGNRCWGTFTVEDKLPPVVSCNCVDDPVILPFTSLPVSVLDGTEPTISDSGTKTTPAGDCFNGITTRLNPHAIIVPFTVSAPTHITVAVINRVSGQTGPFPASLLGVIAIHSAEPLPGENICNTLLYGTTAQTITTTDFNFGAQLQPGIIYYLVFSGYYTDQTFTSFTSSITAVSPGVVIESIFNPANEPECQFRCVDLDVVQRETVGMLYNIPGQNQNMSKLTTPPTVADCGPLSRRFNDRVVPANCGSTKLVREWIFTDAAGNSNTCTQTFSFNQLRFRDLTPPVDEVVFTCGLNTDPASIAAFFDVDSRPGNPSATNVGAYADDYGQTPNVVELHEGFPFGYYTYNKIGFDGALHPQKVDLDVCDIYTIYEDIEFPACGLGCGGNMKVVRKWTLLNWCTKEVQEYFQVIKSIDQKAPTFDVKDITVGVSSWECVADWRVELPWELQDNCAKPEEIVWGVYPPEGYSVSGSAPNFVVRGLPKGDHEVTYWAQDCCGNYTEKIALVRVIDASAPIAVAKENIVISLTNSGTSANGQAKLYAWQVDNGSYDACSEVGLEIRRTGGGACGNVGSNGTHNNNRTFNHSPSASPNVRWAHPDDTVGNTVIDTDGGEFVKFCCEDIPAGAAFGLHEVELRVWDDGNMNAIIGDNDIIDGMRDNYNTTWATIRVENKLPPQLVCPPDVTLTCDMEINLFESNTAWKDVAEVDLTMTGMPSASDLCDALKIEYRDQFSGNRVCNTGTVQRTFRVVKGDVTVTCRQTITLIGVPSVFSVTFPNNNGTTVWDRCDLTLEDIRNFRNDSRIKVPVVNYSACDIIGENITIDTFLFEDGACKKWKVTYEYINWCTNATSGPWVHNYTYKDDVAPILSCNDQMFEANPNPQNPNGGCEGTVRLQAAATDQLICTDESWIKWQVFMDGWNNGTVDRLGSTFVNKAWFGIWVSVPRLLNGALNPAWTALQAQHPGVVLADVVFVTYVRPSAASGGGVSLPPFTMDAENISHKVTWKITDGCGNIDQCESTVMVVDKKAPTPYCVSISTALMQGTPPMVELWAKDFDKGSFDNCTPQSKLYFTFDGVAPVFSRINEEHFFKAAAGGTSVNATAAEYNQGRAYKWIPGMRSAGKVFTQAGDITVRVDVWDEAWNTDYCSVTLSIREASNRPLAGTIKSFNDVPVNDVLVSVDMNAPEYPMTALTNIQGQYQMDILDDMDFTISSLKDKNPIDGVSTLDLVMIQRHLLDIQPFTSPYQHIAADANNDRRITSSDMVEIRRLVLGIDSKFRNNQSWRFVVANTPVGLNPITFEEVSTNGESNFIGIKVGDVNGSALGDANGNNVEPRTSRGVIFAIDDLAVKAGSVIAIPVKAERFNDVSGFQFTLNVNGAQLEKVEAGALEVSNSNIAIFDNNVVTMSYASLDNKNIQEGEVLFTLYVNVTSDLNTREMFTISSDVTKAESYTGDYKVGQVSWNTKVATESGYALMQNEPNPFKSFTKVSFEIPQAASATMTVTDVTGKIVIVKNIDAVKGLNTIEFTREEMNVSGVVFYTLTSGEFTATKKMILVD